ncbi:MAG TPA: GNAT family N-acetyltransferase [Rhizomicrobium sp.]|nr:GNAT family N-acetyltransferase [Rhizomicrobium sp.]
MTEVTIRRVQQSDLAALLDIYNHYVVTTPITFDLEPRTLAQRQLWLDSFKAAGRHQCFVAVRGATPIGWSCSGKFRDKAAYDTSVEMSVYLAPQLHGRGLGRRLYNTVIDALQGEDIHRLYAGITLPNAASVALHLAFGFHPVGVQSEVGRKFGRFWDVALYERPLETVAALQSK